MAGIKKILIPIKQSELTIEKVKPYLPSVLEQFLANKRNIRADYNIYCLQHNILTKQRAHDDTSINNKVLEPHIKAMVDWKTGYVFGNPITYAQTKDSNTDDITFLNKYARFARRRAVDSEVAIWAYATGVGYYFVEPTKSAVNTEYEAPFELFCRDADSCTKVYSAYNGKKPLFDILYTEITEYDERDAKKDFYILDIYFPNEYYQYKIPFESTKIDDYVQTEQQARPVYNKLPLVEKRLNANGIGIVAMAKEMQDAIDTIASNGVDNIQEFVNVIYKYQGISLGKDETEKQQTHKSIRKNGAIEIPYTGNLPFQPDLKIEGTEALNFKDVLTFSDSIKRAMYETVGVPLATNETNSGGTTKSGSEVANGYDNAYNRALTDINNFLPADTELLEKILFICKNTANNKLNDLQASEIEIKYSLNLNDNMQIKTQSLGTCIGVGMPPAMALRITRLSNDPEAEGEQWQKYLDEQKAKQQEQEQQKENDVIIDTKVTEDDNKGNPL